MTSAFDPPLPPMLAKRASRLPRGEDWIYEPKWDGFRVLVFRTTDDIYLQSRGLKPLARYFPDLLAPLEAGLPQPCVLDGEVVIARDGSLDFEALQMRLHPAESRVQMLADETPASIVFFDLLAQGDQDLRQVPFEDRRAALERLLAGVAPPLHLTPATRDRSEAEDWFRRFEGAGLDGVMAKRPEGTYEPKRRVMVKVKHRRECDCVVAGFRWHKSAPGEAVGSLLLGLYDEEGILHHVGVCGSFTDAKRRELVGVLAPYRADALEGHPWKEWAEAEDASQDETSGDTTSDGTPAQRVPGGTSRWSVGKDLSWVPIRPELVAEVTYDHMQSGRFRHNAHFRRWRPDKAPEDCTYDQLEVVPPEELATIFAAGR